MSKSNWLSFLNQKLQYSWEVYVRSLYAIGSLLFLVFVFGGLIESFSKVYGFLLSLLAPFSVHLIGVLIILLIGIFLYFFRKTKRKHYGMAEIAFGLASGWQGITRLSNNGIAETIAVIASIYLIVRGLDNWAKGREEEREKQVGQ